jgi:transposase-like protein
MTTRVYKPDRSYRVNSERSAGWAADPIIKETIYESMATYYAQRMSDNAIAEHVGVSTQTVFRWRHRTHREAIPK